MRCVLIIGITAALMTFIHAYLAILSVHSLNQNIMLHAIFNFGKSASVFDEYVPCMHNR